MLGDGNIWGNIIKITLNRKEEDYIKFIKLLFYNLFEIEFHQFISKKRNITNLHKGNKELANLLLEYGLKRGRKRLNNIGIPNWIFRNKYYLKSCLRGLIDTDGCIYLCKREKKMYIKFTNRSLKLLEDFKKGCDMLNIHFVKGGKYNAYLYKKEGVERFINTIGFSNKKHINRMGLWCNLE